MSDDDWSAATRKVAAIATELPEVTEGESYRHIAWSVKGKSFAWMRPFSKADIKRFGDEPIPGGPILAVRVEDLGEKEAVLESGWPGFFTIPHFDGFSAVLVQLDVADESQVRDAIVDAWLACAPAKLADAFLQARS